MRQVSELNVAALAERAATGHFSDLAVRRWLADGMEAFLRADGALPLEQCLRLPNSDEAQRRVSRASSSIDDQEAAGR